MSNTIDTNNWHTVAAVTYEHLNTAILEQKASPTTWEQEFPDGSASVTGGTFGPWQIRTAKGNNGTITTFRVPITGGTLTALGKATLITPCEATVTLHLNFFDGVDPTKKELRVDAAGTDDNPTAVVADVLPPIPNGILYSSFKELLQLWLSANLQSFGALFATVDLGAEFAHEGLEWLRPSWHGYAVAELENGATMQNSIFGVLCLIDGETNKAGLADQVSVNAIPPGADAGFVIAPEKFLQHFLLPGMVFMFKDISDQDVKGNFVIDNDGTRIRSIRDLTLHDFEMENGHKVSNGVVPAGQFTLQISETELEITNNGINFEYSPGIHVILNSAGRNTLSLDTAHSILTLNSTLQTGSGSVEISKALDGALIGLEVAAVVAGAVAAGAKGFGGILSKAAEPAIAAGGGFSIALTEASGETRILVEEATVSCLRGIISGTAARVGQIGVRAAAVARVALATSGAAAVLPIVTRVLKGIADSDYQNVPKINDLTSSAIGQAVQWPKGVPEFELVSAQLNGALQFGFKAIPAAS
ncbi:MAG: TULIP family P47-like protein [Verrucomicrobiaceae bacterium]|nr:TULIP family P47-like protein [Verrucomicrobiaceae bacterium]